jgi:hypothetical protein
MTVQKYWLDIISYFLCYMVEMIRAFPLVESCTKMQKINK